MVEYRVQSNLLWKGFEFERQHKFAIGGYNVLYEDGHRRPTNAGFAWASTVYREEAGDVDCYCDKFVAAHVLKG